AKMHLDLGDTAAAIEYLYKAHEFGSLTIDLVLMTSMTLVSTGDTGGARQYLDSVAGDGPIYAVKALRWRQTIGELYDYVAAVEAQGADSH
ncbi:MAG: hypothetical protein KJO46_00180, partial [Gammaproteobacteria bacterium]|nr:hypothetical protein [Gammaproteobacteria bacterium]